MNVNRTRAKWYGFSYGCHLLAWPLRWLTLSFAALAFIEFVVIANPFASRLHFLIPSNHSAIAFADWTFRLLVAWAVVFGLLTLISAWFNIWFRYVAWWAVKYWRSCLVIFIVAALIIWRHSLGAKFWVALKAFFVLGLFLKVAAAVIILLLLYGIYGARRRLVILPFANYTGDDTLKCSVEGLAPQLLNELGRLAKLYSEVDDASLAEKSAWAVDKGLSATVSVEDVGDVLQSAVSPESQIKFWGIEIPVGSLFHLFGQLARGPRLGGSLHKEGNRLVLIAGIDGGRRQSASWRINPEDIPEAEGFSGTDLIGRMLDQLGYRVFADLVPAISQRWQAVRWYAEGLRVLRITTRTKKDKEANLRQAEKAFLQALGEDFKFARNHYNLGLVYNALGERDAARAAFWQAVKADSDLPPAYYALALDAWDREDYSNALGYCCQVIELQPTFARAWDLKGLAERRVQEQRLGSLNAGQHPEVWPKILASREIAAALAWRSLCKSRLTGRTGLEASMIAQKCVRGVAVALGMMLNLRRAQSVMEQALYLAPGDADLHFELGKILTNPAGKSSSLWSLAAHIIPASARVRAEARVRRKRQCLGLDHLQTAVQIDPTRGLYWARLAESLGQLFQATHEDRLRQEVRTACEHAMDFAAGSGWEAEGSRAKVVTALTAIGEDTELRTACEYAMDFASRTSKKAQDKLRLALRKVHEDADVRAASEYATKYASGDGKKAQGKLRAALEVIGKDDENIRAAYARARNSTSVTDQQALDKLQAALKDIGRKEIRAVFERAATYAPGMDKGVQDKLRVAIEVLRENKEITAECTNTVNYASATDKRGLLKLRTALAVVRRDNEICAACNRAMDYVYGIDKQFLEKLRVDLEVFGQQDVYIAGKNAMARSSAKDKKTLGRLQDALFAIADGKVVTACDRALNYASRKGIPVQGQVQVAPTGEDYDTRGLSLVTQFLGQLVQSDGDRAAYLTRLAGLESWLNLVLLLKNLSGQGGGWDGWAYGQVAGSLAQALVQTDPVRAQRLADRAIQTLRGQHAGAIREQSLYCTLAQAYLNQGKPELYRQALVYAQQAVALNPEGPWERSTLAQVYWTLGDYNNAEAEWNTCLDLNPGSAYLVQSASTRWQRGASLRNPQERKRVLQRVNEFFGRALKTIESTNLKKERLDEQMSDYGSLHYWTGRLHFQQVEFDQAVTHLQMANNMGYKPLESMVYLGWSHAENRNYDAAEASFREAISRVRSQQQKGLQLKDNDSGVGEDMQMLELLILTYLLWSYSYSEHGARPKKAEHLAQQTRPLIRQLGRAKAQQYRAAYFDCIGYARLRMGRVDDAVKAFERSLALAVEASTCMRLAEAYCRQAAASKSTACLARAREVCTLGRDTDLQQRYGQQFKELEERLAALAKPAG